MRLAVAACIADWGLIALLGIVAGWRVGEVIYALAQ
jgi:hypothetical protein